MLLTVFNFYTTVINRYTSVINCYTTGIHCYATGINSYTAFTKLHKCYRPSYALRRQCNDYN